jgi:hypothetical protein
MKYRKLFEEITTDSADKNSESALSVVLKLFGFHLRD